MPEVLILCEYPTLHGGERSMLATLGAVRAAGFAPVVMAPPQGPLAEALAAHGVELIPFPTRDDAGARRPQRTVRGDLSRLLQRRRPGLLHANSLAMGRLSGPVAAALHLPSLAHLRDIVRISARAAADLNSHRRLLAVSHATREFHVAQRVAAEKTRVCYNGVDLAVFSPRPRSGCLHRELALPPEAEVIGTIGQIGLRKGQDILLRAAAALAGRFPQAHWVIVGRRTSEKAESRQFEAELRAAAAGPLAGQCHFLGERDDVDRLLNELTLLVHPARQEPLGRVLLEAAAAGVAIVASDVGGTREIFPPGSNTARLVPPNDSHALAEAIAELLGDEVRRIHMATAARCRAEAAFDIRIAAAALVQHYQEISVSSVPPW